MEHYDDQDRLTELKERLAQGTYSVDPSEVADAIMRRGGHRNRERDTTQSECS